MQSVDTTAGVTLARMTLKLDTALDYSLGGSLSKSILAISVIIGMAFYLRRRRAMKSHSVGNTIGDLCTTVTLILALTLGTLRWLEFTIVGSVVASDFTQDYIAAHALRQGVSLYSSPLKNFAAEQLHFDIMKIQPEVFNFHPPFNALLFLPFSFVPHPWAFISWNIIATLAYAVLIYGLLEAYGIATFRTLQLGTLLLIWEPFVGNIALGQVSTVLALLIIGGFLLLERRERPVAAGLMFGLATLIKLFPGLIFLYLLFRRHWRCAGIMAVTVSSGLALTLVVIGSADIFYYLRDLLPEHVRAFAPYPFNISIESVVRTLLGKSRFSVPIVAAPAAVQGLTLLLNSFLLLGLCLLARRYPGPENAENLFVLFCLTMLLISPITWPHTCLVILFPMAMLWHDGLRLGQRNAWRVLLVILILFAIPDRALLKEAIASYPLTPVPWYSMLGVKLGFFGLLILWATFYRRLVAVRPHD